MTDCTIQQTRPAATGFSLAALLRNWRARSKVRALYDLDDRMLTDIGVRRDEVIWASHLPLTVNAALELEDAAFRRRRKHRRN
ncbi:DUF1127 domain-containing protein [Anderseniella sp. Alg231-50]|uniref:DUF1127 domain-containing protein n=1 Tax=Anderseniella sp. Alg231-50 TaxID=1922226 RepID=UPI000D551F3F